MYYNSEVGETGRRVLRELAESPWNDAAKIYDYLGYQRDPRIGDGCLHQAFGAQEMLGGTVLYDRIRLHFAVLLPGKYYYDPSWGQIDLPSNGFAPTLAEGYGISINDLPDGGYSVAVCNPKGTLGSPFLMRPYHGDFGQGLNLLMDKLEYNPTLSFVWHQGGVCHELEYDPDTRDLYHVERYYNEPDHTNWTDEAARFCGVSTAELIDYFVQAHQLWVDHAYVQHRR